MRAALTVILVLSGCTAVDDHGVNDGAAGADSGLLCTVVETYDHIRDRVLDILLRRAPPDTPLFDIFLSNVEWADALALTCCRCGHVGRSQAEADACIDCVVSYRVSDDGTWLDHISRACGIAEICRPPDAGLPEAGPPDAGPPEHLDPEAATPSGSRPGSGG